MYSGGWAFSNSRKSVKYPPHDPHTSGSTKAPCFKAVLFGILQKPNKRQSQPETNTSGDSCGDQARARARAASFPPSISASVAALLLIPVSIEQKAGFSLFCYPVHIPDQQPAHTTPAHTPAFRPAVSRPHDPASITRNTTTICTKTTPFICAIFQSKNTCISGYCVVQYRQ